MTALAGGMGLQQALGRNLRWASCLASQRHGVVITAPQPCLADDSMKLTQIPSDPEDLFGHNPSFDFGGISTQEGPHDPRRDSGTSVGAGVLNLHGGDEQDG